VLHETVSVSELAGPLGEVLSSDCELLVLAGGDGTFMSGVTAAARAVARSARPVRFPKIALLPLGTVGTVARNLGDQRPPETLLEEWLSDPRDVAAVPRPTLRVVATAERGIEERVGFIVGTGLVANFFEVYEEGGAGGTALAGRIVARVFAESFTGGPLARRILTPLPCTIEVEGEQQPLTGVSLLCAAVVRDLGLGMKVCYRAGEDPERFHLVVSGLPPAKLGPRAPLVMMGRSIGGENHVDRLTSRLRVSFPGRGGPYVLDGDTFRARSFEVTPGPIIPVVGPRTA
jgi:diacylglycerol kinase family enzyme